MTIIEKKTGNPLDIKIIFSFVCPKTKRKYVAFDFQKNIFDKNSSYNNLDLLEITKEESNVIYVSEIRDSEWDNVKHALQHEIFSNIKKTN